MVHFNNLEHILQKGMCICTHPQAAEGYINIGDKTLIPQRQVYPIPIVPGGNLGDYVPFYFAGHSPMLLNIKTGYRGIAKRSQDEIVFVVCRVGMIVDQCPYWCFTDGHAKGAITRFYNKIEDLKNLDWNTINLQYWHNCDADWDRQRKKEAEFLVKYHVPKECISCLVVYSAQRKEQLKSLLERLQLEIPVYVDENKKLYYP